MEEVFYDKEGNPKEYAYGKEISSGTFGIIYKLDNDKCIKIFRPNTRMIFEYGIKTIRDLQLENFYRVYDLFYNEHKKFKGYTMKLYEDKMYDVLIQPTEYLVESFLGICRSVDKLTDLRISINDMRVDNIITTEDGIIVIDADQFFHNFFITKGTIKVCNNDRVYTLFNDLFRLYASSHGNFDTKSMNTVTGVFRYNETPEEICKKLIKYKYPVDYLKSCR